MILFLDQLADAIYPFGPYITVIVQGYPFDGLLCPSLTLMQQLFKTMKSDRMPMEIMTALRLLCIESLPFIREMGSCRGHDAENPARDAEAPARPAFPPSVAPHL
jgi:hypothetical protein